VEDGTYITKSNCNFLITRPLKEAVRDYCEYTGETMSTVMRLALTEFLTKHKEVPTLGEPK
jgi:antitoxin component of RelBE/YafQ-DinJ toxin-antitoxin module